MTMNIPLEKEPPIYMTRELPYLPYLISCKFYDMSLSSEDVSKQLEKNILQEGKSFVLVKGEVDRRKTLSCFSELNITLKSLL